ncbi:RsfA family transcriptional regulator [Niallia endozanthoxylica]|uniref:RsfA family transcriptional regulator n=1 Tax=Niallia endozanthoxylica TaxID=2036016 RepID=A0A5J5HTX1_9BACI|nr:RsfA family transcriptional regulator [Niallia endozanthoxylica]KAA9025979.1 RsfA family transcriptional regulator [Niallia endozanthoxylica]
MSTTRQDAWTQDEDLLLAEVVLRHIREGGTQLQAFEEVGKRLSRTAAACGFRWNSSIRKLYKSGIELAKKQRKDAKRSPNVKHDANNQGIEPAYIPPVKTKEISPPVLKEVTFEDLIGYLNKLYDRAQNSTDYQESLSLYEQKMKVLEQKIQDITAENDRLSKALYEMEHDYKALIEIMERARKMVVLKEEEFAQKVRFQMDRNGNLEKLDK